MTEESRISRPKSLWPNSLESNVELSLPWNVLVHFSWPRAESQLLLTLGPEQLS